MISLPLLGVLLITPAPQSGKGYTLPTVIACQQQGMNKVCVDITPVIPDNLPEIREKLLLIPIENDLPEE